MKKGILPYILAGGFIIFHLFSLKFLRYYLGWKELVIPSYLFVGLILYLWWKSKITKIEFTLLMILPFIVWVYSHLILLIRYSPYGWVSLIMSIYFFFPYMILICVLAYFVLRR